MNDLNILKDVGLKEVARKTHIQPEFLQYIIDKDYEKLVRVNVAGYIKILQREYSLDLSEWLEQYNQFCKEHKTSEAAKASVSPKFEVYTPNGHHARLSGNSLGWLLWLIIIVGFIIASYFFDAHKYIEQIPNIFEDKNRSATYSDASVVKEVSKNISIFDENSTQNDKNLSFVISLEPTKQLQNILNKDENLAEQNTTQITIKTDEVNATTTQETPEIKADEAPKIGTFVAKGSTALIVPKGKVWLGVIDLKNGKKTSLTTQKEYELNLSNEMLIACGNGNIVLKINGEDKSFDPGRAARFLVKDGEIRFLNYDEFLSLNGGKSW
ncbi:phosphatidylglycerophosphate synthase [Campylobacter gastrosuis]|uniref:Phosphatidylglycerophosphate synthase n=1 Tax=Campylobacter gastrosuis TaxID=2974576 RepID=A0ABT7HRT3_9BACT|nr:phosphatidylglycerophosphate synthase [Campylobacter gastrosuis]MDL0089616.1 phosphatidylglycerophosphate synthase [Campylobacter gastrosuis]